MGPQLFIVLFFVDLSLWKAEISGIALVVKGLWRSQITESHECAAGNTDGEAVPDSRPRPTAYRGNLERDVCRPYSAP